MLGDFARHGDCLLQRVTVSDDAVRRAEGGDLLVKQQHLLA